MSKKGADKGGKEKEISNLYKELAALRPSADFDPSTEEYEKAIKVGTNSSNVKTVQLGKTLYLFSDLL